MAFNLRSLNDMQKGIVCIIFGILILLYALNFFQKWLNVVVVGGAVFLLVYGFMKIGGIEKIKELFHRKKR